MLVPNDHITFGGSGSNRTVTVIPAPGQSGAAIIAVTVSDGALTARDTFTLTVGTNSPPVAQGQVVTTEKNGAKAITLVAADADGDTLAYLITAGPLHGALSGAAPAVTYLPSANYVGGDSFTFSATDGQTTGLPATVTIQVTAGRQGSFTVVDWGGTYCTTAQNYRRAITTEVNTADYGGSNLVNDARRYVPFSDTSPLSPAANYSGTSASFYGGWNAICYDAALGANVPLGNRLRVGPATGGPNFMEFGFAKAPVTGEVAGVAVWAKHDFLDGWNQSLTLTSNCTLRIYVWNNIPGAKSRLVVKDGAQYYLSKSAFTNVGSGWLTIDNPTTETWATFNPAHPDHRFSEIGPSFVVRAFSDVQALGYYQGGTIVLPTGTTTHVLQVSEVEFMAAPFARAGTATFLIVR
jgi:hypothetical protein